MFLSVSFKGKWHRPETQDEVSRLIDEIFGDHPEDEDSWFCVTKRRHIEVEATPGVNLRMAVNRHHGYGALIWFADKGFRESNGIYDSVWISDSPDPVGFDPRVVSDPGYPLFHDPASTLPISKIRAAVTEFCGSRSGNRPVSISWVTGHANGQRSDRPSIVDFVEDPEIDWDSF